MLRPRSPLAIIIPSLALISLEMFETPDLFSIFEIIFCFGNNDFICFISAADSAKEIARYLNFKFFIFSRSFRSFMSIIILALGYFLIIFLHSSGEMYLEFILRMEAPAFRIWGIRGFDEGP